MLVILSHHLIMAALEATLALVGPGEWSVDARLFGRKHIEMPRHPGHS
jgi:hypothetical protein